MWGKITIPMYRLWLHGLYGLYGPRCPLSPKRPINLISVSLSISLIKVFLKIFIREISNMPLILYFSHIFTLNAVLEKISRKIFKKKINERVLLFDVIIWHNNVIYRWKPYEKTNILTYNMLKSVVKCGSYCIFSQHTRYHKIDKNTTTTVTGHYLCTEYIVICEVSRTTFLWVCIYSIHK